MEPSPHSELAALVAAWHNRHPLARRITPAQVQGPGLVALPFVATRDAAPIATDLTPAPPAPAAGWRGQLRTRLAALWQRLPRRPARPAAAARPAGLRAAFDEDFIAPLRPAQVARFARRQGSATRPECPLDWPQRDVNRRPGPSAGTSPQTRYLRTAAIEVGSLRRRVLVGIGPRPAVIGPRLWSRPRCTAAASVAGLALVLGAWFGGVSALQAPASGDVHLADQGTQRPAASGTVQDPPASAPTASAAASGAVATPPPDSATSTAASAPVTAAASAPTATVTAAAASAASAPSLLLAHAPAPAAVASAASASTAASAATVAATPAEPPLAAPIGDPRRGIRPLLSAEAKLAAREQSEALRAAHPAPAAKGASASDGRVYAVATPSTRTRAGAQLRIVLMNAPTDAEPGRPRAEILQVGAGWRAVIWPFDNRDAAERTRDQLVSRGIPAEVIDF